ncbi:EAL domain-containing protein [Parafrankia sp. FMc2]|uniref:EAL domain-containing protein n=1 Tax=Parafrankia sp. FMc2 TaxID=3233196 RepID=UPI0034D411B5
MIAGVAGLAAAASSVGMLIVTADGRVAWVNDALVELVTGLRNPDSAFEARLAVAEAGLPLTGLHPSAPPAVLDWTAPDGSPRLLRASCRDMSAGQPSELLLFEIVDLTAEITAFGAGLPAASAAVAAPDGSGEPARGVPGDPAGDLMGDVVAELAAAVLGVAGLGETAAPTATDELEPTHGTAAPEGTGAAVGDPAALADPASLAEQARPDAHGIDPLTGLSTRYALAEELESRVAGTEATDGSLLILDIDHLADVNDLQGYSIGDAVLRAVAQALREELPDGTRLGRLGGDEFAVVLPAGGGSEGLAVAEQLCAAIAARTAAAEDVAVQATVSIGVVPLELAAGSEAAFAWADLALREAKRSGRNRVRLFTREQYDEAALRVTVTSRVAAALDNGQMSLDVLPVVDLASREIVGFELLSRLRDGVWPELGPRGFLAAAEHTDLGLHLDRWVVLRAVNALVSGLPGRVYVNLAARSLRDPAFGDFILSTLRDSRVDPARLALEIPEGAAVANLDAARRLAEQLTAGGCPVLLDDFGMTSGAVIALRNLPLWAVKIDSSLVRTVDTSARDRAVVEAVVQIARTAGMTVIAEGVDRAALPQVLLDIGVTVAQGYHVGRPRRLAELLGGGDGGDDVTTVMSLGGYRR